MSEETKEPCVKRIGNDLSWNMKFVNSIPSHYGKGVDEKIQYLKTLISDFDKAGIKINFEWK